MKKAALLSILFTIFVGCTNANEKVTKNSFTFENQFGDKIVYQIIKETKKQTKSFNSNPKKNENGYREYNIISCSKVIQNLAGKINYGYGAFCEAIKDEKKIKIKVCENQAYSYKLEEINKSEDYSLDSLAKFTSNYCYGG